MPKIVTRGDVSWHLPDRRGGFMKRPFAYSTVAESNFMALLAEMGHTFASAVPECRYAPTERAICQRFVAEGYGDVRMLEYMR